MFSNFRSYPLNLFPGIKNDYVELEKLQTPRECFKEYYGHFKDLKFWKIFREGIEQHLKDFEKVSEKF